MNGFRDIYLIRHGRLLNSEQGVLNGQSDVELTEEGLKETIRWIDYLKDKNISLVCSSDLKRTMIPASFYAESLNCKHIFLKEFREINAGRWEGLTYNEIIERDGEYLKRRMKDIVNTPFPEGESLKDMRKRVMKAFRYICRSKGNLLFVGHAGSIRIIIYSMIGISLKNYYKIEVSFGSLSSVRIFDDGNCLLRFLNKD